MAVTVGLDGANRIWSLKGGDLEEATRGEKSVEEERSGEVEEEQGQI